MFGVTTTAKVFHGSAEAVSKIRGTFEERNCPESRATFLIDVSHGILATGLVKGEGCLCQEGTENSTLILPSLQIASLLPACKPEQSPV